MGEGQRFDQIGMIAFIPPSWLQHDTGSLSSAFKIPMCLLNATRRISAPYLGAPTRPRHAARSLSDWHEFALQVRVSGCGIF